MAITKNQPVENNSINIIGKGTSIIGNLNSDGDIRIDGSLEGNIKASGKVLIGKTGNVKGDVFCSTLDISGNVTGKVNVSDILSLKASANISGEINTQKITIEPGAVFNGTCKMGSQKITDSAPVKTV
jgi:cytoskeletal protein CcmA (bactofilin family)